MFEHVRRDLEVLGGEQKVVLDLRQQLLLQPRIARVREERGVEQAGIHARNGGLVVRGRVVVQAVHAQGQRHGEREAPAQVDDGGPGKVCGHISFLS